MKDLTYNDGYKAGQLDRESGLPYAWTYDHGSLQGADWKQGYSDGKLDFPTNKLD